jgi:hypothetical protein
LPKHLHHNSVVTNSNLSERKNETFDLSSVKPEEVVNAAYKIMLTAHFVKDLPEFSPALTHVSPFGARSSYISSRFCVLFWFCLLCCDERVFILIFRPVRVLLEWKRFDYFLFAFLISIFLIVFCCFIDFAVLRGAKCTYVSNQSFARVENLIAASEPGFDPRAFGRHGKVNISTFHSWFLYFLFFRSSVFTCFSVFGWFLLFNYFIFWLFSSQIMDSWESTRHNAAGVDMYVSSEQFDYFFFFFFLFSI